MPRLKGRQYNTGLFALLLVLIGIGIAIPLEYLGFTNLITNFDKAARTARAGNDVHNKQIIAQDTIDKVQKIAK